jgi:hypothetical protein
MLLELLPDWFTARSHTKRVGRESLPDKGPYQANVSAKDCRPTTTMISACIRPWSSAA